MNGLIIIGYQGIGKSSLNKYSDKFIDFESSLFNVDGDRVDNWHIIYCKQAVSMAKQGHIVLMSSHKCVRDELSKYNQEGFSIITITPAYALKDEWIEKLYKRYLDHPSEKNSAAYLNAKSCYEETIREMASNPYFSHVFINNMKYNLRYIILHVCDIFCYDGEPICL